MPSLADQMQIEIAERGQEAVRVLDLDLIVGVGDQQPVVGQRGHRQQPGEEAVAVVVEPCPQSLGEHGHRPGVRAQRPEGHTAPDRVGAEQVVRGVVLTGQQPDPVAVVEGTRPAHALADGAPAGARGRRRGGCRRLGCRWIDSGDLGGGGRCAGRLAGGHGDSLLGGC